jgi:hypothetical protein
MRAGHAGTGSLMVVVRLGYWTGSLMVVVWLVIGGPAPLWLWFGWLVVDRLPDGCGWWLLVDRLPYGRGSIWASRFPIQIVLGPVSPPVAALMSVMAMEFNWDGSSLAGAEPD